MALSNLSIVIPVYNEQERISASLDTILEYLANSDFHCEILIGDDGSDDNTVGVVNKYVEKHSAKFIELEKNEKIIKDRYNCFKYDPNRHKIVGVCKTTKMKCKNCLLI